MAVLPPEEAMARFWRLGADDERAVRRFLARQPAQHAYLLGLVERGALQERELGHVLVGWFEGRRLMAVASLGQNLVISATRSARALAAIAGHVRELGIGVRVVAGPDDEVGAFMSHFGRERVIAERAGQVLMEVDRRRLSRAARSVELRPAQVGDLDPIWRADRAMIEEELGLFPFANDPEGHRRGCERRILEQRSWVIGGVGGPLSFKVDQSAVSPMVVQLAGVYTVPERRRQGLAFGALGEMCHLLTREAERVALFVDAHNEAARRLYRRLGFCEVGRVRSVWLAG